MRMDYLRQKAILKASQDWERKRQFYLRNVHIDSLLVEGAALGYIAKDEWVLGADIAQWRIDMERDEVGWKRREIEDLATSQREVLFVNPNIRITLTFARKVAVLQRKLWNDVDEKLADRSLLTALGFKTSRAKNYQNRDEILEVTYSFMNFLQREHADIYRKVCR